MHSLFIQIIRSLICRKNSKGSVFSVCGEGKKWTNNSIKSYNSTNPCFAWYFQIVVIQSEDWNENSARTTGNSRFHLTFSVNFISVSSSMILNTSFSSSTDVETLSNLIPRQKRNFSSSSITTITFVPSPILSMKTGRHRIHLSNEADEQIRLTFHLLLVEKIYPRTWTCFLTSRTLLWSRLFISNDRFT